MIRGSNPSSHMPTSSPALSFKTDAAQSMRLEGPLWGRKSEFKRLNECFQRARRGQAQIILVEGEKGIGKTRLIQEWLHWASMQGAVVLVSGAYKAGGRLPYQPIIELLRRHMEAENAPEDLLTDVWLTEISRLLPELRERYPDLPLPINDVSMVQNRLYEAIARLTQAWAQRAPLVLFVDNIQWADTASLDLLHYLARFWQEQQTPVSLVLTQCRNELAPYSAQEDWHQELKRILPLSHLVLQAFTFDETQQFLGDLLKYKYPTDATERTKMLSDPIGRDVARFGQWLFDYTDGQPFYMLETLNSLVDFGILKHPQIDDGAWQVDMDRVSLQEGIVPENVSMLLESRVNSLSPAGKDLVAIVAILGHGITFEQFRYISGAEQTDTLMVLDEVINSGLLCQLSYQPHKLVYGFKHAIIQQAVYRGLDEARKRWLHQRILRMQESEPVPTGELYYSKKSNAIEDVLHYS
jgi:predicted ATPase